MSELLHLIEGGASCFRRLLLLPEDYFGLSEPRVASDLLQFVVYPQEPPDSSAIHLHLLEGGDELRIER
jgi:hypothetical protein